MKVKKFSAVNNQEALMKVRAELGPDAVILHQRKIKPKGLLGYFKKPLIEVVAAIEDTPVPEKNEGFPNFTQEIIPKSPESILRDKIKSSGINQLGEGNFSKEIDEIKRAIGIVARKVDEDRLPNLIRDLGNKELERLYNIMKEQELEEEVILQIISELREWIDNHPISNNKEDQFNAYCKKIFEKLIVQPKKSSPSKVMFFIGPTGVGKTTTIAKLAASFTLNQGKSVGLISADTYRIAAVEQLKTYSDILSVPLEVIYEPKEIHHAINKLKHKDLILVDTAGRSHRNKKQIMELQALLGEISEKEIYLVVSSTAKNSDMKEIINTYKFIDNYKIIFTKIDEATNFGTILNTIARTQKPLSYITTGQSVPDDIEMVDTDKIFQLFMKEVSK